jgi:hypothetical protein
MGLIPILSCAPFELILQLEISFFLARCAARRSIFSGFNLFHFLFPGLWSSFQGEPSGAGLVSRIQAALESCFISFSLGSVAGQILPLSCSHGVGAAQPDFSLSLRFFSPVAHASLAGLHGLVVHSCSTGPCLDFHHRRFCPFHFYRRVVQSCQPSLPAQFLLLILPVEQLFFVSSGGFTLVHGFLSRRPSCVFG